MDFERFRLRRFLESLPAHELERRDEPIALGDVAAIHDGNPKAVWFARAGGAELAANVTASRSRLALAFGTTPGYLLAEVLMRLAKPQPVLEVNDAPVQAVVEREPDLTQLPVHLQHAFDGAPYISASMDFTRDTERGITNVGIRRLMLRGRREAGVDLNAPSDLRAIYQAAVGRGERLPIAFVVGSHPIDHVAATMRLAGDELALIAALRGAPLPAVKCKTNDLRVPADAEYVLEGYLDERGYAEAEGPYGEFLGYYGGVKANPVFHLSAITRRRDAIFQAATISGRTLSRTDTAQLNALRAEVTVWRALETAVREVQAVYATPSSGGAFNVRVALRQRVPGEARNAIAAVFGCLVNVKHVFVVDADVDVFSDEQMDWALATRFQAARDLVIADGFRGMPLDPSLRGARTGSKAGFDLTLPFGERKGIEARLPVPPRYEGRRHDSLEAALAEGPKFFVELMSARDSRDGREIVRELERLRASGRLERDAEGRYVYRPGAAAH
ncbi:MAG TPA: UbiD family decarboxylase [Burkholderiales bacterium]|nr:UbiD family decarboxylase [Burkholderiales bacterium]